MKRFLTALAAGSFLFTLFFMCSDLIKPVKASAADVDLSVSDTLRLFGQTIQGVGYLGTSLTPSVVYFDYITDGEVYSVINSSAFPYDNVGKEVIVYKSREAYSFNNTISSSSINTLSLFPDVDLSNLYRLRFSIGLTQRDISSRPASNDINYSRIRFYSDFYTGTDDEVLYKDLLYKTTSGIKTLMTETILANPSDWSSESFLVEVFPFVFDYTLSNPFTFVIDPSTDAAIMLHNTVDRNAELNTNNSNLDVDTYTYLIIECPSVNDDYVNNHTGGDSGGGDGENSFIDYSSKLDTLINQGITFNEQLNDIYMENQHQNSKLDSSNQKLDTVNSNLNKINSSIENINIPDLVSQSGRDSSHIADNTSRMAGEISDAMQDHQYIDSIARSAEMSLPNLDNQHALDSSFNDLWYYTDDSGLKWSNPLLFAMPIVTLTIGVLSYIIFGKKG